MQYYNIIIIIIISSIVNRAIQILPLVNRISGDLGSIWIVRQVVNCKNCEPRHASKKHK